MFSNRITSFSYSIQPRFWAFNCRDGKVEQNWKLIEQRRWKSILPLTLETFQLSCYKTPYTKRKFLTFHHVKFLFFLMKKHNAKGVSVNNLSIFPSNSLVKIAQAEGFVVVVPNDGKYAKMWMTERGLFKQDNNWCGMVYCWSKGSVYDQDEVVLPWILFFVRYIKLSTQSSFSRPQNLRKSPIWFLHAWILAFYPVVLSSLVWCLVSFFILLCSTKKEDWDSEVLQKNC